MKRCFVQGQQARGQRRLLEERAEPRAVSVEIVAAYLAGARQRQAGAQQQLRLGRQDEGAALMLARAARQLCHTDIAEALQAVHPRLQPGLRGCEDEAEVQRKRPRLPRRVHAAQHLADALLPCRQGAFLPPKRQLSTQSGQVREAAQKSGRRQLFLVQRQRHIVPKLPQPRGRLRPEMQRVRALDAPARMQAHHVLVVDAPAALAHALEALLQLAEVVLLIRREPARQPPLDLRLKSLLRLRRWRHCLRLAGQPPPRGLQHRAGGQLVQGLLLAVALLAPTALRGPGPAHVHAPVVEDDLGQDFILEEIQGAHRVIISQTLRLLPQARLHGVLNA